MSDLAHQQVIDAWRNLANVAAGIIPSKIMGAGYNPDMDDATALIDDLRTLARHVDNVVEAYGDYCENHRIIHERDKPYFRGQLFGTLEGDALWLIEDGTRELVEARQEEAREFNLQVRREAAE